MEQDTEKIRTQQQNRALWKYLTDLANALNESGVSQKMFVDELKGWEVPITKEFLHLIWKLKQEKMFMTDSTTKMTTRQVTEVYDAVNMFTSTQFGVSEAWPSIDELAFKALEHENRSC